MARWLHQTLTIVAVTSFLASSLGGQVVGQGSAIQIKPAPIDPTPLVFYAHPNGRSAVPLFLEPNQLGVVFRPGVTSAQARRIVAAVPGVDAAAASTLTLDRRGFAFVPMMPGTSGSGATTAANTLAAHASVATAAPAYAQIQGQVLGFTQHLIASFHPNLTPAQVETILITHNLTIVETLRTALYTYLLKAPQGTSALAAANQLVTTYGSSQVRYAHPNFMSKKALAAIPNDPLFNRQWHLNATNVAPQSNVVVDADIDAPEAWDLETGNSNTIIAVIDTGFDLTHPDLNFVGGFDPVQGDTDPSWLNASIESHATAVAGVAAARGGNSLGVAGVCQHCRVMPIRLVTGELPAGSDAEAEAINFARDHGAVVINNSWGPFGGFFPQLPPLVVDALEQAVTVGRGGLGLVVVFASGNTGEFFSADFNGYVTNPNTLAVGASTSHDVVASYSSWTSHLDVVAPSGDGTAQGNVWTTDMVGSLGYGTGDYTNTSISGTSFSAPQVSGLAALMIAANPQLSWTQVRDLLHDTADKIDPGHPTWVNGFSTHYGYGKVNALRAVQEALDVAGGPGSGKLDRSYPWPTGGGSLLTPGQTKNHNLVVPDVGTILTASLQLTWNHPNPSQVTLRLKHPDGTLVTLWDRGAGVPPSSFALPTFGSKALAGTYQFQGTVVSGGAAGSIDAKLLQVSYLPPQPPPTVFTSQYLPQAIPDDAESGLSQYQFVLDHSGVINEVTFDGVITHPDRGDLRVVLVAADGTQAVLHDRTGAGVPNLTLHLPVEAFRGLGLRGVWRLIVQDLAAGQVGTLNSWSLSVAHTPDGCAPPQLSLTPTGLPAAIPNNNPTGLTTQVVVNQTGTVNNTAGLYLKINHTAVSTNQITVTLIHPDGFEEVICGQMTPFFFDTCPWNSTGSEAYFTRNGSLGKNIDGTWKLRVVDAAGAASGTLVTWRLDLPHQPLGCPTLHYADFDATLPVTAIPDQDFVGVTSTVTVPALAPGETITDVDVQTVISHSAVGDLKVYLIAPSGTAVLLHDHTGGTTADLDTTFDTLRDGAQPLSAFRGQDPAGTWRLWVVDDGDQGVGTLDDWKLILRTREP